MYNLTDIDIKKFKEDGYIIFDGLLNEDTVNLLKNEIKNNDSKGKLPLVTFDAHSKLITNPVITDIATELMGNNNFRFHHLHSALHKAGMKSLVWHHDYEQNPQVDREHLMIHVFFYLDGLNGTIGDLLIVPGSHNNIFQTREFANMPFNFFQNFVRVNNISKGSVVFIHSATVHAREAKPGGDTTPRYFIDIAYCSASGTWPIYMGRNDWSKVIRSLYSNTPENQRHIFLKDCFYIDFFKFSISRITNVIIPYLSIVKKYFLYKFSFK